MIIITIEYKGDYTPENITQQDLDDLRKFARSKYWINANSVAQSKEKDGDTLEIKTNLGVDLHSASSWCIDNNVKISRIKYPPYYHEN